MLVYEFGCAYEYIYARYKQVRGNVKPVKRTGNDMQFLGIFRKERAGDAAQEPRQAFSK